MEGELGLPPLSSSMNQLSPGQADRMLARNVRVASHVTGEGGGGEKKLFAGASIGTALHDQRHLPHHYDLVQGSEPSSTAEPSATRRCSGFCTDFGSGAFHATTCSSESPQSLFVEAHPAQPVHVLNQASGIHHLPQQFDHDLQRQQMFQQLHPQVQHSEYLRQQSFASSPLRPFQSGLFQQDTVGSIYQPQHPLTAQQQLHQQPSWQQQQQQQQQQQWFSSAPQQFQPRPSQRPSIDSMQCDTQSPGHGASPSSLPSSPAFSVRPEVMNPNLFHQSPHGPSQQSPDLPLPPFGADSTAPQCGDIPVSLAPSPPMPSRPSPPSHSKATPASNKTSKKDSSRPDSSKGGPRSKVTDARTMDDVYNSAEVQEAKRKAPVGFLLGPIKGNDEHLVESVRAWCNNPENAVGGGWGIRRAGLIAATTQRFTIRKIGCSKSESHGCRWQANYEGSTGGWFCCNYHPHSWLTGDNPTKEAKEFAAKYGHNHNLSQSRADVMATRSGQNIPTDLLELAEKMSKAKNSAAVIHETLKQNLAGRPLTWTRDYIYDEFIRCRQLPGCGFDMTGFVELLQERERVHGYKSSFTLRPEADNSFTLIRVCRTPAICLPFACHLCATLLTPADAC